MESCRVFVVIFVVVDIIEDDVSLLPLASERGMESWFSDDVDDNDGSFPSVNDAEEEVG